MFWQMLWKKILYLKKLCFNFRKKLLKKSSTLDVTGAVTRESTLSVDDAVNCASTKTISIHPNYFKKKFLSGHDCRIFAVTINENCGVWKPDEISYSCNKKIQDDDSKSTIPYKIVNQYNASVVFGLTAIRGFFEFEIVKELALLGLMSEIDCCKALQNMMNKTQNKIYKRLNITHLKAKTFYDGVDFATWVGLAKFKINRDRFHNNVLSKMHLHSN